ncbi:MAG: anaerobic ribonucleoside-triphosphate reductase activating protein [Thermodesulfobacteriota bacterium]
MDGLPNVAIKGFLETSFLDWPGQVAAVLFLAGCNFRCPFCHNHGLVLAPQEYPSLEWPAVKARLKEFSGWIDGVVVTGGEPTVSPGLEGLIREIRAAGFQVKLDTNGSRPEVLASLLEQGLLDHVAMDVKAPLDEVSYARAAGRPDFLEPVRQSLEILENAGVAYTLRTTVVPDLHSERDLFKMAEQLRDAPQWNLQNFNPENALDCAFRDVKAWDHDYFTQISARVQRVQEGRAA